MKRLNTPLYPNLKEVKIVTDKQHDKEDTRIRETYGPFVKSRAAYYKGKPETQYYIQRQESLSYNRDIVAILKIKR